MKVIVERPNSWGWEVKEEFITSGVSESIVPSHICFKVNGEQVLYPVSVCKFTFIKEENESE